MPNELDDAIGSNRIGAAMAEVVGAFEKETLTARNLVDLHLAENTARKLLGVCAYMGHCVEHARRVLASAEAARNAREQEHERKRKPED